MKGLLIGLISIAIPVYSLYSIQNRFPVQDFLELSPETRDILFHPTWDVMLMFFIVAAVFLYAISTGRGRVALILMGTYVAYGIASFIFLQTSVFGVLVPQGSIPKIVIFAVLLGIVLFFLFRSQVGGAIRGSMGGISWWNALLQSILEAGLLSSFLYTFLSSAEIALLAPITKLLIGSPEVQFAWIFAPFLWFFILTIFKRE